MYKNGEYKFVFSSKCYIQRIERYEISNEVMTHIMYSVLLMIIELAAVRRVSSYTPSTKTV